MTPHSPTLVHDPVTGIESNPGQSSRQYGLDGLRIIAICGVVAIHVIGLLVSNDDIKGTPTWWIATALDLGVVWVVPAFVMISGALTLAPQAHAKGPGAFYRRRFARIIPALIAWHVIYLVGVRIVLRDEHLTMKTLALMLIDAKVYTALYFLWLIAGLYVIAPVLAAFLHAGGEGRARVTAAVSLGWTLIAFMIPGVATLAGLSRPIALGTWTMWWPWVGFFIAGWALRTVRLGRIATLAVGAIAVGLVAEGVWQWGMKPEYRTLQLLNPISALGTSIAIATLCIFVVAVSIGRRVRVSARAGRILVRLSEASFGVFLVHLLILELLRQAVPAVAERESLGVMLAAYAVVLVVSFAVSIAAAKVRFLRTIF